MLRTGIFNRKSYNLSYASSVGLKIAATACIIAITALAAQVRIPLAWTPVPVTGQTFAVLLAGVLLGKRWGSGGMLVYGALGVAGVPWFNAASGGFGATTGYVVGFVLAAYFVGHYIEKNIASLNANIIMIILFCGAMLIYIPGVLWLWGWLNLVSLHSTGFVKAIEMGAVPFIAGDVLKAVLASGIGWVMLGIPTRRLN